MKTTRVVSSLALAFLMAASILAVTPAQAYPVTTQQAGAVQGALGDGAPFSTWQVRTEANHFFLHSGPTTTDTPSGTPAPFVVGSAPGAKLDLLDPTAVLGTSVPGGVVNGGAPVTEADAIAEADPGDHSVVIALPRQLNNQLVGVSNPEAVTSSFVLDDSVIPKDVVRAYSVHMSIWAACQDTTSTNPGQVAGSAVTGHFRPTIEGTLTEQAFNGTAWSDQRVTARLLLQPQGNGAVGAPAANPDDIQEYAATGAVTAVGSEAGQPSNPAVGDGQDLQPGVSRFVLRLALPSLVPSITGAQVTPAGVCYIHYDSVQFNSNVQVTADSARLALFERTDDQKHVTGFPSGATTDDRKIIVETLQASPWGAAAQHMLETRTNLRLVNAQDGSYLNYVENADDSEFPNADVHVIALDGRSDAALGASLVRRTFTFHYPATLVDNLVEPQLYSIPNGWQVNGQDFRIGGRGIAFALANGENSTHFVNTGEPTQFTFNATNIGTQEDQVSVTADDPGSGWSATVLGGGQLFLPPGASQLVAVEVVPPAAAVAGAVHGVTVHASSMFADVPDPAAVGVVTRVVSDVVRKVDLSAASSQVDVHPGVQKSIPVTLTNLGTARDSFVVIPSFPSNVAGWTVTVNPTSIQVEAGSRAQLGVVIRSPAEPEAPFPLGLTATEVQNGTVAHRIDLTVRQLIVDGLLATPSPDGNRTLRQHGPECLNSALGYGQGQFDDNSPVGGLGWDDSDRCTTSTGQPSDRFGGGQFVPDADADNSAMFRIPIKNLGDLPDDYKVDAVWAHPSSQGSDDGNGCDGDSNTNDGRGDGVPDGWRFNWADGFNSAYPDSAVYGDGNFQGFGGTFHLVTADKPIHVEGHSQSDQFLEIGHVDIGCLGGLLLGGPVEDAAIGNEHVGPDYSRVAEMALTITSLHDASRTFTVSPRVVMQASGTRSGDTLSGGTHDKLLLLGDGETDTHSAKIAAGGDPPGSANFVLRAINTGNEHDDVILHISGDSRWFHSLTVLGTDPDGIDCENYNVTKAELRCHHLGVYDEIQVLARATPLADATGRSLVGIGDTDPITVTARSGDSSDITDHIDLHARAAGTFAYTAFALPPSTRTAVPGQTVALPFDVENLGTEGDTFLASLAVGDAAWSPVLSSGVAQFVPAGHDVANYLAVTVPQGTPPQQDKLFRVKVVSATTGATSFVDMAVHTVAASRLVMQPHGGPDVLIAKRQVPTDVKVDIVLATGSNLPIRVAADQDGLPTDWTVTPATQTVSLEPAAAGGPPAGQAVFHVTAPKDALGTSRAILRVSGVDASGAEPALQASTDVALNLASTFGLDLNATPGSPLNQTIAPGGYVLYNLTLENLGLGSDSVRLTHTALPDGWTLLTNPGSASLGPLQSQNVTVKLSAPTTAQPKDVASVVLFAASTQDPTALDSVALRAQVGFNQLRLTVRSPPPDAGPQETVATVFNLTNLGTLPDRVRMSGVIDTRGVGSQINGSIDPPLVSLDPGETKQILVQDTFHEAIPSNTTIQGTLSAQSLLDRRAAPASANATVVFHILPYVAKDVNGDGKAEYAVDRNRDASDGYEVFQASRSPGGRPVAVPDLQRYLRDDARTAMSRDVTLPNGTVARVLVYTIDGDHDGKADFFLDIDGDNQPDLYWDPDAGRASPIDFRKDVNGDQVPELFVDTDGDGRIDAVFDLTRGTFTNVIQTDVDGDGQLDYVVDKNGNGQVDQDETVLYTRTGKLLIVQKVDVDGDGKLDQVFDTDGDGNPDYFIPSGSTKAVPIVMKDVNGDGVQDWTFDGNNDGRYESYYDPVTGQSHVINAAGHLADALKHYWYIGALFGVVLVLFVALVMVTRK